MGTVTKIVFLIVFSLWLAGCGGGGGDGDDDDSNTDNTVEQTLTNLGVDISVTPREDENSESLPDDYNPLGSSKSLEQFDELVVIGFALPTFGSDLTLLELDRVGTTASYTSDVLFTPAPADTPWALSVGDDPAALRVAARGDVDQDGLEELFVVYRAPGESSIELQLYEDQPQSFAEGQNLVISTDPADSLAVASGDFNGDGYAELVIGLVHDDVIKLLFVDNDDGVLSLSTLNKTLPQAYAGSEILLVIESGNLDYDPSYELVVLVNEFFQQAGDPPSGTSRYFVFDDAKEAHVELGDALVQSVAVNRTAIVADVSLGDVDGDNLDEMVFAGLTHFDPNDLCTYNYLLMVLDDRVHDGEVLGAKEQQTVIHNGCASSKGDMRFVHVNTPDLDGDGIAEIQANEVIFEDFAQYPAWTPLLDATNAQAAIPQDSLFAADDDEFTGRFSHQNSTMVVADLTADKRQDIILYSQSTNRLEIWGLSEPDAALSVVANQWRMLKSIPLDTPASSDELRPLLVPINVNHDGLAISFDAGSYQLVFTEPVLIATLAAAPCYDDLGQNTDACRTSYGSAESQTVEQEDTLTISAGVTVGVNVEINAPVAATKISEVSAKVKVSASFSLSHSSAYTYSERVVYTTGPIEDTVIFTTIPYDVYKYSVTSHPDPEMIGVDVVVSMPRSPVTLQVERGFYNANVAHGGPRIDSSVFTHTAGNPSSYPSSSEKDSTMSYYSTILPTLWAYDFGPTSVGQGGGDTTLEINIATESGMGGAIGVESEFEAEATFGFIVAGFSVGVSAESSLQIIHGVESTYTGTVANLPSDTFAENYYSWGLFTYVMDDHASGQQFEVLNYWVE
jgi:FG-GAP-like repeat